MQERENHDKPFEIIEKVPAIVRQDLVSLLENHGTPSVYCASAFQYYLGNPAQEVVDQFPARIVNTDGKIRIKAIDYRSSIAGSLLNNPQKGVRVDDQRFLTSDSLPDAPEGKTQDFLRTPINKLPVQVLAKEWNETNYPRISGEPDDKMEKWVTVKPDGTIATITIHRNGISERTILPQALIAKTALEKEEISSAPGEVRTAIAEIRSTLENPNTANR